MAIYIKGATKDELEDWLFTHGVIWDSRDIIYIAEPHGRLIDESVAYDKIAEQETGYYMDMDGVDRGLQDTPTVIEGSE